jgi:hypothetical protein
MQVFELAICSELLNLVVETFPVVLMLLFSLTLAQKGYCMIFVKRRFLQPLCNVNIIILCATLVAY